MGQFPPLAGSNWVAGSHERMTQVILHGLQGEVTVAVKGKESTYNLAMPPQGGALTDEQIAAITTYVRSAWGNKGKPVTPKMVAAERKATAKRKQMWTQGEIEKAYPFPGQKKPALGKIENLIALVYEGKFGDLDDLRKAEPVTAEEEKEGYVTLRHAGDRKDNFGVVWTGEIVVPKPGVYIFEIDSDDGSAVHVGGKKVVELKGAGSLGRLTEGKIRLEKGRHDIKIEYFERMGGQDILVRWRGPGMKRVELSEPKKRKPKKPLPSIPIVAEVGEATIYRNFIQGTTARGIGVGYDRGLNVAFSADTMALELMWSGKFLDGGLHWTNRGRGNAKPQGDPVLLSSGPAFAILPTEKARWPEQYDAALKPQFLGYTLNAKKQPTFAYRLGNLEVTDFPEPKGGESVPGLARRITIEAGEGAPEQVMFQITNGNLVTRVGSGGFRIDERVFVQVGGKSAGKPILQNDQLLLPINLKRGKNEVFLNYTLD